MNKFKLATSAAALLCASSFAFAGGPDMPMNHNSIYAGVGGGLVYSQSELRSFDNAGNFSTVQSLTGLGLAPTGQIGYDYYFGGRYFAGIKAAYTYVDTHYASASGDVIANRNFNSTTDVLALFGFNFKENSIYMEGGYSGLYNVTTFPSATNGSQQLATNWASGGLLGLGYRRMFWHMFMFDAVYTYAYYGHLATESEASTGIPGRVNSLASRDASVQKLLFTLNYVFNF